MEFIYKRHWFSHEIIRHAIWLYHRFTAFAMSKICWLSEGLPSQKHSPFQLARDMKKTGNPSMAHLFAVKLQYGHPLVPVQHFDSPFRFCRLVG
jgi:hypothetical protein